MGAGTHRPASAPVDRKAATAPIAAAAPAAPRAEPGLVLVYDGRRGLTFQRIRVVTRVGLGRGEEADVRLDDTTASRMHAVVSARGKELTIDDPGSTHGIVKNGERTDGPTRLAAGDVVRLGRSLLVAVDEARLPGSPEPAPTAAAMIGGESARRARDFAARFAPTTLSILLLGETGTGKEVMAELVHELSGRKGPLVGVNCAALPRELAESQLFGHRRGAFSGATDDQPGYFVAADGGTLLLDEVGDLSLDTQAKLLRVLETMSVTAVGASQPRRVDVRIVAATCKPIDEQVRRGQFRDDLYHRLNGVSFWLPPLRERNEDVALLVPHFLRSFQLGVDRPDAIDPDALEALLLHRWPGNVRELRQCLHAAAVRANARGVQQIATPDLELVPAAEQSEARAPDLDRVLAALKRHGGNVSRAARELEVHRAQIYRVLEENGLRSEQFRGE
jgi:sigma-54 dependent transcriptional regulator, acetoin dehydrogenase operon transcriptional activator AcoR